MDWETVSFVFSSDIRFKLLLELRKGRFTPTQLSKFLGQQLSHISKTLAELQEKEMVTCLTPNRRKAKLFTITEGGEEVLEEINKMTRRTI